MQSRDIGLSGDGGAETPVVVAGEYLSSRNELVCSCSCNRHLLLPCPPPPASVNIIALFIHIHTVIKP